MKMNTEERKIKNLVIKNYKCFKEAECSFEKADGNIYQWNVFLGNNNSGKTNLLKIIAGLRASEITVPSHETDKPEIKMLAPAFIHDKTNKAENKKAPEKKEEKKVLEEKDLLYDRTVKCICCDNTFKEKTIRMGKARMVFQDMDLRPRYDDIDSLKYNITK